MSYKALIVAAVCLLLSGFGIAQNLPDAPSVSVGSFPSVEFLSRPVMQGGGGAAFAATDGYAESRTLDAAYWESTTALLGTTVANVELTARCSEQRTCLTEIAPGSARAQLYAYTLPTDVAVSYLAYRLKGKTRLWRLPQMVLTAANVFSAGRSYGRIQLSEWYAHPAVASTTARRR